MTAPVAALVDYAVLTLACEITDPAGHPVMMTAEDNPTTYCAIRAASKILF